MQGFRWESGIGSPSRGRATAGVQVFGKCPVSGSGCRPLSRGLVQPSLIKRGGRSAGRRNIYCGGPCGSARAPSGAPPGFCLCQGAQTSPDSLGGFAPRVLPRDTGSRSALPGTWLGRALPGFAFPSPASSSQSGHDAARADAPEPPGSGVTTPARRHRTLSHSQDVSRERPSVEKVKGNIGLVGIKVKLFIER